MVLQCFTIILAFLLCLGFQWIFGNFEITCELCMRLSKGLYWLLLGFGGSGAGPWGSA